MNRPVSNLCVSFLFFIGTLGFGKQRDAEGEGTVCRGVCAPWDLEEATIFVVHHPKGGGGSWQSNRGLGEMTHLGIWENLV